MSPKSFISYGKAMRGTDDLKQRAGLVPILCIYHGKCADGFGAAWAMRHNWPFADIEFYAADYADKEIPDVKGRVVYMLDFSYKRSIIAQMIKDAETFLILDHHKSAFEELWGLDDYPSRPNTHANITDAYLRKPYISNLGHVLLDLNRSGALLSWDFFSKGKRPPALIQHIDDRDRWQFKLPGTREIQASVFSFPYDFTVWDTLMITDTEKLRQEGEGIERKHFKDLHELLEQTTRRMIIGGYDVPVANMPYTLASDGGHILAKGEPFSATYFDTTKGRKFSLRSQDDGIDVSLIAKSYGGGGHLHASGFIKPIGWEGEGNDSPRVIGDEEHAV
jgi:hypothetical protein